MKTQEIKGKNILLLGYGRENQSAHRFLLKYYPDVTVAIADKSPVLSVIDPSGTSLSSLESLTPIQKGSGLSSPKGLTPTLHTGKNYLSHLKGYDTVIRSPGIPCRTKEIRDYIQAGGHVTSATNIFFSLCTGMTIGITGTKGKSTTSALVAHILKTIQYDVRLVGNIGNPMLDHLNADVTAVAVADAVADFSLRQDHMAMRPPIYVIELSSHQLEDCRYSPHVAVLLNIFPEHLDYYKDFDQYVAAKTNIVAHQTNKDFVVYDDSNETTTIVAQQSKGQNIPVSLYEKAPISKTSLIGNDKNIRTALAVIALFGVPVSRVLRALQSFQPLAHRLEPVGTFKGVTFYNDSLSTIPEATVHALEALGDDVTTLVAGGFDRGLDYSALGKFLAGSKIIKTIILFPDTGKKIWQAILVSDPSAEKRIKKYEIQDMEQAVSIAYQHTPKGKACLLSPAAASYNMFKDYADRGSQFKKWIEKLH